MTSDVHAERGEGGEGTSWPPEFRDEDGGVNPIFLTELVDAVETSDRDRLIALVDDLHEADLGIVIQTLEPPARGRFVALLGDDLDFAALTEVDETVRAAILDAIPNERISERVLELDPDDAVGILEELGEDDREAVLAALPIADRIALERSLEYPEDSAGRLMTTRFIAIPPFWSVGQTIDFLREHDRLPETFTEIYVVDPRFRLLGVVALDKLLRAKRAIGIVDLMSDEPRSVAVRDDQETVARLFERYNLLSVAVVDESKRLVGVITVDDVVDVIEEEADEDIRRLAGVGDEELSDNVPYAVRSRFPWLTINLGTATLAATVIGLFDATIEQMVALAVLMPIVASMGGNAGTQTMTVTVRALATRDIETVKPLKLIAREGAIGLANGLIFALLIGLVTFLWFGSAGLAGVIAAAMIVNLVAAGLAGILIPLGVARAGIDPAIASGVFVTAVTDVVGFFAFLGLAAWWLGIPAG